MPAPVNGFIAILAVSQDAGQFGDFAEPPAILFALDRNGERHGAMYYPAQLSIPSLQPTSGADGPELIRGDLECRSRLSGQTLGIFSNFRSVPINQQKGTYEIHAHLVGTPAGVTD